jgi:hypothetical protein
VDSPFERNLLCKSGLGEIWWKVNVDKINHQLLMQVPEFLTLPKEALLLLQ